MQEFDYLDNIGSVALADDGTRAFIFWGATGKMTSQQGAPKQSLHGLNFLLFNKDGKISKNASFRLPMSSERQKIVK